MAKKETIEIVANQVFIGVPWKNVKRKYETAIEKLKKVSPLSFVIVGRADTQDAKDLLELIKRRIGTSSYAIFDATGGNANVSLEYGYAEALDVPRVLYVSTHAASHKTKEQPIISDLAGKTRQQYKTLDKVVSLLEQFSKDHPYTKRFERFITREFRRLSRGRKKRSRSLALKIVHSADHESYGRREDVVLGLQADHAAYTREEIDKMIRRMHKEKLIFSEKGPHSRLWII